MGKAQKNKKHDPLLQKKGAQQHKPLETPIKKQQNKTPPKAQNEAENKPADKPASNVPQNQTNEGPSNKKKKKNKKPIKKRLEFFNAGARPDYESLKPGSYHKLDLIKKVQKSKFLKSQRNPTKPARNAVKIATPSSKGKSGNASQPITHKEKRMGVRSAQGIKKMAEREERKLLGIKYSAAGVILYSKRPDNTVVFLLGEEDRSEKRADCKNVWLNFGGKIEKGETSASQTALRELIEETGGLFTEKEIAVIKSNLTNEKCPQFSVPFGNYVLFFVECPYDQTVPQRFKELGGKNPKSRQTELMWCDAKSVLESVAEQRKYFISRNEKGEERKHTFYPFFARLLNHSQVVQFLKGLLAM